MKSSVDLNAWKTAKLRFTVHECGGGGNCLFHVVARALSEILYVKYTMRDVRIMLATTLTRNNVTDFLDDLQQQKTLPGMLDVKPLRGKTTEIKLLEVVKRAVCRSGNYVQGTDMCLRWLCKYHRLFRKYQLGFLIFNDYGYDYIQRVNADARIYICIYNHGNSHWRLVKFGTEFCAISSDLQKVILQKKTLQEDTS
jgi:hypothetical protein